MANGANFGPLSIVLDPQSHEKRGHSRHDADSVRSSHSVQFYEEDDALLERLEEYIGSALGAGNSCIVVATAEHSGALLTRLNKSGIRADRMVEMGQLIVLDAADTLKLFAPDGWPDGARFNALLDGLLSQATLHARRSRRRVTIYGEMVALLWADGKRDAAIRLEQLWNELGKKHSFSLLCGYPIKNFSRVEDEAAFRQVCGEHSDVMPCESYTALTTESDRLVTISQLQQKAQILQTIAEEREHLALELAGEIEELRKLHELSMRLPRLDSQQMMQEILQAVVHLHQTEFGLLSIRNPEREELLAAASVGLGDEFLSLVNRVPAGAGACGTCMARGERVIVEDTAADPIFAPYFEASRVAGFRAVHSTPLMDRSGKLIGVLSVQFRQPYRPSVREMRLTDLYAHMAANAIENARLLHESQSELTLRRNTELALRQSEEFSRSIVENSADCIKVLDAEGRLVYMSAPGQRALGIEDMSSILGRHWVDFWALADRERAAKAIAAARKGGVGCFEGALSVGGRTTWWSVKISPIPGVDGQAEKLIAISREITELKLAQATLIEAEKLAAAGRLAATVAHEINNPLEAVTNFIYLAKTTQGLPEDVYRQLDVADQELSRVGHIAQQTLGFYKDNSHSRPVNVAELIDDVASVYERKLHYKKITLEKQTTEGLRIVARQGDLKQVLSNLLTNAIDAIGERGRIALRAREATAWQTGTRGIRITVADNGVGMSPEVQAEAFVPFFTTKSEIGTGIGLWVTRNLIERHGGFIRCRSAKAPVPGTVMDIFLPLVSTEGPPLRS